MITLLGGPDLRTVSRFCDFLISFVLNSGQLKLNNNKKEKKKKKQCEDN